MPTAAKLVAALLMAALFAAVSWMALPLFQSVAVQVPRYFLPVNAAVGLLTGWAFLGARVARTPRGSVIVAGMSHGLTALVVGVFWVLLVHGFVRMIEYSLSRRYGDMAEALVDVFARMAEFGQILAQPDIVVALGVGAIVTGVLAAGAGAKWR